MLRRVAIAVAVALTSAVLVFWIVRRGGADRSAIDYRAPGTPPAIAARQAPDPRTQPRGSIRGAIRDEAGAPIAHARVCADASSPELPDALTRDPVCSDSDSQGRYQLANLVAADYSVEAAAPRFRPAEFHPQAGSDGIRFPLAAGEARTGADLVLIHGGVEITGVVQDVTGGPVAHAQVRATSRGLPGATIVADDRGEFSLWVPPVLVEVTASANGYAPNTERGRAPGRFEIALTPTSSLAGKVVDAATEQPVEGARVAVLADAAFDGERVVDITDAEGKFRVEQLTPGRFMATALTAHGYGRSEGSTLIGLGQHVDGVVIKLFPSHRVAGKVVIATTREVGPDCQVELRDLARDRVLHARAEHDGQQVLDGAQPGTYAVAIYCQRYRTRDHYDPVEVSGHDVTGLVWEVDAGSVIRGKVVTRSGEPVEGAYVRAENTTSRARPRFRGDFSREDGGYELPALAPGTYRIAVQSTRGISPDEGYPATLAAGATVERDLVLDEAGAVTGTVVDETGAPVPGIQIVLIAPPGAAGPTGLAMTMRMGDAIRTDTRGAFAIESVRPGDYRIHAQRTAGEPLRRRDAAEDAPGEKATVRAGQTATVHLVVAAPRGAIRGTVVDGAGAPVSDAWISAVRESAIADAAAPSIARTRESWWSGGRPALTSANGEFTVTGLSPAWYTLLAYRKGGGETAAEHVAVGATVRLQIKPTGSIEGTARLAAATPQDLKVTVRDAKTGFARAETFYMTRGQFTVTDLPAGHFMVTAEGDGASKTLEIDLHEAEAKAGLDLALEPAPR